MLAGFPHQAVRDIADGRNPVKVYREYRKMTQEELAKKAVVSVSMIRKIENGESEGSISTIKAIVKGLFPHFLCFLKIPVLRQTVKSGGMEHMHAVSFTISGDNQYNIYGRIVFPLLSILR